MSPSFETPIVLHCHEWSTGGQPVPIEMFAATLAGGERTVPAWELCEESETRK